MKKNILICFTASFPYGLKETFFENELPYLAPKFDEILIIPMYNPTKRDLKRDVPSNVICYPPVVSQNPFKRIADGLFNLSPLLFYLEDFIKYKAYRKKSNVKKWANSLLVFRTSYLKTRSLIKDRENHNILLYSYWGEAPIFATKLTQRLKKVLRLHRVDFYLEANNGYLPLRKRIYQNTDILAPISEDIKNKLISDYGIDEKKILLSRLGVAKRTQQFLDVTETSSDKSIIRLFSCSRVDSEKRLSLLATCLKAYKGDQKIEWHHFGDGKLFADLKRDVLDMPNNVHVILYGWKTQDELFTFYRENMITWFINVSESEGIPVSIMEAMAHGVPVIATDVGGSSEIVNNENGFLLPKYFDKEDLLKNILDIDSVKYKQKRLNAYRMWELNYQSEKNYNNFVRNLQVLGGIKNV